MAVFFDFASAFPSLAHEFIWVALEVAGFPDKVISAIRGLYNDNRHWWRRAGRCFPSVTLESGVKQGCPLSPLLYVIVGEAFHRFLVSNLGPRGILRFFADDTAVVPEDIWTLGPMLASLFGRYESIGGLHFKPVKCVLVNLGRGSGEALKKRIAEEIPAWADFPVSGRGKYLGTWLGPSASEFR